jgi:AraC-like DNA-binding protein
VYVTGVTTARFDVDVAGWGRVVGVRFRPGGLAALTRRAASAWTDRVVPATDVLPRELCDVLADETLAASPREWASTAERALLQIAPEPDERYARLLDIVAAMLDDHTLLTVADVCERHGTSTRTLQRLFTHYVGIGPKWVLARYRMHDVVAAIDAGYDGTLTDLAVRFGFYDQAHFTREFTALIGVTPSEYRRARDER